MTIDLLSMEEHQRVLDAEARYGAYFTNARDATILLSNIMMWPTTDCEMFIRFLSQMKKHHTLSLLSLVRLHRIQAKMVLRYFLEATVNAAYSLTHSDTKIYVDHDSTEQPEPRKATTQAYKWIENEYPSHSKAIKLIKDTINEQTAHANIFNSQHNFRFVPGERAEIHTTYFDIEDEHWVKVDLWQCAQAGLIATDLLLAVREKHGGFLPSSETHALPELIVQNDVLFITLKSAQQTRRPPTLDEGDGSV